MDIKVVGCAGFLGGIRKMVLLSRVGSKNLSNTDKNICYSTLFSGKESNACKEKIPILSSQ